MGADLSAEPGPQGILQSVSGLGRPEDGESAADPQMASLCHLASEVCLHACMYVGPAPLLFLTQAAFLFPVRRWPPLLLACPAG